MEHKIVWSHSALKDYEGCARRYHEVRVLKNYPFEKTEQIIYGEELHKAAELYVRDGVELPPQFAFVKPTIDALLLKPGRRFAEHKMALTIDLQPCDFFAEDVWVRGIVDLLIVDDDDLTAWIVDYKTGSDKYPDIGQLELMSLLTFAHFPHVRHINSALLFVVKGTMHKHKMSLDRAPDAWWKYRERVARLAGSFETNVWNPSQSPLCKWCQVKGCEFNPRH